MSQVQQFHASKIGLIFDLALASLQNNGVQDIRQPKAGILEAHKGQKVVSLDLNYLLFQVAVNTNGTFDAQLNDPTYESIKMLRMLGDRLKVLLAALESSTQEEETARLIELSESSANLKINVIERNNND